MPPEILSRVFEPFFTTKPVGKGTGLGLSQIFGFIGQSRGEIQILSHPGKGTEVLLYLPRYGEEDRTETTSAHADMAKRAEQNVTGAEILIVEEDPRVLSATFDAVIELGNYQAQYDPPSKEQRKSDSLGMSE